jgi:hypothetical protein
MDQWQSACEIQHCDLDVMVSASNRRIGGRSSEPDGER